MSGPLSRLLAPRRAVPAAEYIKARPAEAARQLSREDKQTKDRIADLCRTWRARGAHGASYARELEEVMGWAPAGDPITGCLPVTPP